MTDRPKNHFRRLIPYGLTWGAFTGAFVHFVGSGFTWGAASTAYWIVFVLIWGLAGTLWAFLTAKYSKRKTNRNEDVS